MCAEKFEGNLGNILVYSCLGELAQPFKEPSLGTFINKCYGWKMN